MPEQAATVASRVCLTVAAIAFAAMPGRALAALAWSAM
jgi:hypothetical protein